MATDSKTRGQDECNWDDDASTHLGHFT